MGLPRLAGIGFNSQTFGDPASQMSGEWTWGAINAAIAWPTSAGSPATPRRPGARRCWPRPGT